MEVDLALRGGKPVVALESTIITHGMPWPDNVHMAQDVEAEIRAEGATPATFAVIDGVLYAGLDGAMRERLARADQPMKLSRADLAFALSTRRTGGTTVAATMMAAALAGIDVFATGGIGGVHRGAETSFDISADLQEFSRSAVITVCAGAKAILDLEKTLEYLETVGVPVVGFNTDELPAFWSRNSGLKCPLRLDTPQEIAGFHAMRRHTNPGEGMLVCNPIPPGDEIPAAEMVAFIDQAVADAASRQNTGKAVTPWLLARILEITGGRSLAANIALVKNNARLAARIAVALNAS
jgi:pseudouridine-5'-phosphate glycosidase